MRGCLTVYVHTRAETAVEVPGVLPEFVHLQLFPDVQGPAGMLSLVPGL